ncbi:MAG TPA: GNAT family N-acetyltransferase [Planctomycetaceae bacterium]|nr:GNAT family N-acetyltransferase [Planctomycetaceae bacterium]
MDESEREGYGLLRRLVNDWQSGTNRFDSTGEVFLIVKEDDNVIGVGGLNIDPYADDPDIGRIRHVYVARDQRRRGIGRTLVEQLIDEARGSFRELRLRTTTAAGDAFYRALGFTPFADGTLASHVLLL